MKPALQIGTDLPKNTPCRQKKETERRIPESRRNSPSLFAKTGARPREMDSSGAGAEKGTGFLAASTAKAESCRPPGKGIVLSSLVGQHFHDPGKRRCACRN